MRAVGNRRDVDLIRDADAIVARHCDFPFSALGAEQQQLAGRFAVNHQRIAIVDHANRRAGADLQMVDDAALTGIQIDGLRWNRVSGSQRRRGGEGNHRNDQKSCRNRKHR